MTGVRGGKEEPGEHPTEISKVGPQGQRDILFPRRHLHCPYAACPSFSFLGLEVVSCLSASTPFLTDLREDSYEEPDLLGLVAPGLRV